VATAIVEDSGRRLVGTELRGRPLEEILALIKSKGGSGSGGGGCCRDQYDAAAADGESSERRLRGKSVSRSYVP